MSKLVKYIGMTAAAAVVLAAATAVKADLIADSTIADRGDGKTVVIFSTVQTGGTWTIPAYVAGSMEVLVVGGGGGGASGTTWNADGGGAGGVTYYSNYNATAGNPVTITIGAGGVAKTAYGNGNNGIQSAFGTLTANGGEGGLSSRGGNSGGLNIDGTITVGGLGATHAGANGGGGAVTNGAGNYGYCAGGNGYQTAITGTSRRYGGGGGGGYQGPGGLEGGGLGNYLGGNSGPGGNATFYGGGGGASRDNTLAGAGYQGVVILAYTAIPEPASGLMLIAGAAGLGLLRRKIHG